MVLLPFLRVSIGKAPPKQRFEVSRRVSRRLVEARAGRTANLPGSRRQRRTMLLVYGGARARSIGHDRG